MSGIGDGPIGKLSSAVTTSIGFVSEVHGYNKAKKAARKQQEQENNERGGSSSPSSTSGTSTPTSLDPIEREWQLDEAQDVVKETVTDEKQQPARESKKGVANPEKVVSAFLQRQSLVPPSSLDAQQLTGKLEFPVVIPQRRPKDKSRGFVRAYAPDLRNVGIEQAAWLDFVETLNEASLANPWIQAINLAGLAASPLPFATSTAISIALMVGTEIAMEAQGRYR